MLMDKEARTLRPLALRYAPRTQQRQVSARLRYLLLTLSHDASRGPEGRNSGPWLNSKSLVNFSSHQEKPKNRGLELTTPRDTKRVLAASKAMIDDKGRSGKLIPSA